MNRIIKIPPIANDILKFGATHLAKLIRNKELKSYDVVLTFIDRIKQVQPLINAIAIENFDSALEEAKKVDNFLKDISKLTNNELEKQKPLLGVPITIKECFAVKGLPNAAGLLSRRDEIAQTNAYSVQALISAGAIVIATSSMPELGLWWETFNTIKGRTNNPYNVKMITGGSSGGEGALIASGASPLGLGSDIGGSIRMPAFFNGIFGHKPTGGIISNEGHFPPPTPAIDMYLVSGPLTKTSEDLMTAMKVLTSKSPLALQQLLKLDESVDIKGLKYFSFCEDIMRPWVSKIDPELREAHSKVVSHFEQNVGVRVQKISLPHLDKSFGMWIMALDKYDSSLLADHIAAGEKGRVSALMELAKWSFRWKSCHTFPCVAFLLQEALIKNFIPRHKLEAMLGCLAELKASITDQLGSDGVLFFPSHPKYYYSHGSPYLTPFNFVYTAIFNVLGVPVTQCPLGLSDKYFPKEEEGGIDPNKSYFEAWGEIARVVMPLGIQVVSNEYNDRLTIAVARELERAFGGWDSSPFKRAIVAEI